MEIRLTTKERDIMKEAKSKGYITLDDIKLIYKTQQSITITMKRLVRTNLLEPDPVSHGIWHYTEEKTMFNERQETFKLK